MGRDCYVVQEGGFFDVPEQHVGRQVLVRWDSCMARVLDTSSELICYHARIAAGEFITALGAGGRHGRFYEDLAYWRERCSRIRAGSWAYGETANRDQMAVRIIKRLESFTGKYSKNQIEKACDKAALHGQYRLRDLKSGIFSPQIQESFSFMESHEIIL